MWWQCGDHQLVASLCQVALLLLLVDRDAAVQVDHEIDPCEKLEAIFKSKKRETHREEGRS